MGARRSNYERDQGRAASYYRHDDRGRRIVGQAQRKQQPGTPGTQSQAQISADHALTSDLRSEYFASPMPETFCSWATEVNPPWAVRQSMMC